MAEPGGKSRVIPIKMVTADGAADTEDLHKRLVRDGWIWQTTVGEPRLSQLVKNYEKLGYKVRVEPYQASDDDGNTRAGAGQEVRQYLGTVYVRKSEAARIDD